MRHFRESNGLASRGNERLTDQQRADGSLILKTLNLAKEKFKTNSATCKWVEKSFSASASFELEYFQIADETTLCLRKKQH
jgi:pantoate--beta-alanine ligase